VELTFVQLSPFVSDWKRLGLGDDDLRALEAELLKRPDAGPIIGGTGGLRKLRFAPPSRSGGKSGATRVIYGLFRGHKTVYLFLLYRKNEQGNLTPKQKIQCRKLVNEIRAILDR